MEYILSKKEYDDLVNKGKKRSKNDESILGKLCMDVARYKPTFRGWDGKEKAHPWGCHHIDYPEITDDDGNFIDEENESCYGYCDKCSVRDFCPLDQKYSN